MGGGGWGRSLGDSKFLVPETLDILQYPKLSYALLRAIRLKRSSGSPLE